MSLLPTVARGARCASSSSSTATKGSSVCLRVLLVRSYATETTPSSSSDPSDIPPHSLSSSSKHKSSSATKSRLLPQPRPAVSHRHPLGPSTSSESLPPSFSKLPPSFGRNQVLSVSNDTRALLESIVRGFDAPIRYAFAYGSGVFAQDGYAGAMPGAGTSGGASSSSNVAASDASSSSRSMQLTQQAKEEPPMVDFMFAVTHPSHFHSINMQQHPSHYPLHARVLGSDYISRMQALGPGVWFNAYIPMKGVTIKYGVTTVDNLCSDLLNWDSLYLAGRMHKPLRIIKDDARVRLTQQVNLTSAVRAALLTLPDSFSEAELFERVAGISYAGDPRMMLPAENRGKVGNIVRKQREQFKELYYRLVVGLPGVRWTSGSEVIEQDVSARARSAHLKKLPVGLLARVKRNFEMKLENVAELKKDEGVYWTTLAGDERLPAVLGEEMSNTVRYPATVQSLKGLVSAGLGKSLRYSTAKVGKWWSGS
ncbi:mitochondrial matrix Mmp37-domain-containing protein [Crepidotus variabilis]|uniref:Phosphatidate cytidylyltransferase, mitochondrial n=1 Tax=Crepidotus variabilis TaxID=179855 RepID=A0A9P6JTH4_9AGAR|nr:mitochondrial matrix Mmp37-domain-containing protein [Crepidotus variabilis]